MSERVEHDEAGFWNVENPDLALQGYRSPADAFDGGDVWIESELGEGPTVSFPIPAADAGDGRE